MKKKKIKEIIDEASKNCKVMRVYFNYRYFYDNVIPLQSGKKLLMVLNEDDFIFDGYRIVRFKDIKKVKIKNDFCNEILKSEGLISNIEIPPICLENWKTVFESLETLGNNIIVEKDAIDEKDYEFVIGKIEDIHKKFVYVRKFDADGIWDDGPSKIPYAEITTITFASRYVDIFSKYLAEI